MTELGNPNQLLAASCNQFAEGAVGMAPNIVQVMRFVESNNCVMAKEIQIGQPPGGSTFSSPRMFALIAEGYTISAYPEPYPVQPRWGSPA